MSNVLDLNKREEFLNAKDYIADLRNINQIVETDGFVHNVKFLGVYTYNKGVFLYTCFDADNKLSGTLAIEAKRLIVGPVSSMKTVSSANYVESAVRLLLSKILANVGKRQEPYTNNGR